MSTHGYVGIPTHGASHAVTEVLCQGLQRVCMLVAYELFRKYYPYARVSGRNTVTGLL